MNRTTRGPWWLAVVAGLGSLVGCGPFPEIEDLPTARATIAEVGKRLGRSLAPGYLTAIAARSDRVLPTLTRAERHALGHDGVRFRVDRPVMVEVAVPSGRPAPFWLADQGFVATKARLRNLDGEFAVHHRWFPGGVVGLGVNGLDRTSPAHYAVFVRPAVPGPLRVEPLEPLDVRATPWRPGLSPYLDADKPFDPAPGTLEGSTVVQVTDARRHDGALAHGRVWKTRNPSGPGPDQVVVSFGLDPARALSFTWRTDPTVAGSALRLRPDRPGAPERTLLGDAHPVDSDGLLNDPTILRHRVLASDLEPDTTYAYAVGDGSPGGWTPRRTIRTAPAAPRDFSFLYLGDAQNELERWGELLRAARRRRPDAGFLLLAGDLVDRGNERANWDHFFLRAAGVFESTPFMPAVGNHEYLDKGPAIYRGTFDLPRNGPPGVDSDLAYAFDYSDAFVAVLDSNLGIHDPELARAQADWLDAALGRTRATWKFVTFHHPVYASHVSRENPQLGRLWGPVFDRHHVDLVLQGHDHAYLRTHPMRAGRPVASPGEGTVYVVAVSGGKFYEQNPRDYTARGLTNLATYQTIDVQVRERRLTYRSFNTDGREVDALVIDKGARATAATDPAGTSLR